MKYQDILIFLKSELQKKTVNFVVKDTYTRGKQAGLRMALCEIEDLLIKFGIE